jgi:hypothetical protein
MPVAIPQVTDPRITIQTFNAPTPPILPGVLPTPKIHLDINLPKQNNPKSNTVIIDNEVIKEDSGKGFRNELKDTIESAFLKALEDDYNSPSLKNLAKHKRKIVKVNVLDSPVERLMNQLSEEKKVSQVTGFLHKIKEEYDAFQDQVQSKMKYLDYLLGKWDQRKLNFIV